MSKLKFQEMQTTANGDTRASVKLSSLNTLWFNTGTLCNLECKNCYIESSPKNDQLSYLSKEDIELYLEEIHHLNLATELIGFTGGEPFLNPNIIELITAVLDRGFDLLILTNANRVIKRHQDALIELQKRFRDKLHLRISFDHFTAEIHDLERGAGAFEKTLIQTKWLFDHHFNISIASRALTSESQEDAFNGHKELLDANGINLNLQEKLVIFPEMKSGRDVPEITTKCWDILNKSPNDQMCATERMIVKRKGESSPVVMPCTLLAYDDKFILGKSLTEANQEVYLNHRFCAEFCVLGGASCSGTK